MDIIPLYDGNDFVREGLFFVKQYGMKRSGTCYTKALIEANFPEVCVVANILGWKHGSFQIEKDFDGLSWLGDHNKCNKAVLNNHNEKIIEDIFKAWDDYRLRFVLTVRNPYHWVVSYSRYHEKRLSPKSVKFYMAAWNKKNRAWLNSLPTGHSLALSYESLLGDPTGTIAKIAGFFKIKQNDVLEIPRKYVSPGRNHGRDFTASRTKSPLKGLTPSMVKEANRVLDDDLMRRFEYEKL